MLFIPWIGYDAIHSNTIHLLAIKFVFSENNVCVTCKVSPFVHDSILKFCCRLPHLQQWNNFACSAVTNRQIMSSCNIVNK